MISFAVALSNRRGILSGPLAFTGSKFSRAAVTSDSDRRMLDSRWFVRGWAVLAGESDVTSEKT